MTSNPADPASHLDGFDNFGSGEHAYCAHAKAEGMEMAEGCGHDNSPAAPQERSESERNTP